MHLTWAADDIRLLGPCCLFAPAKVGEMKHFDDVFELYSLGRLHRLRGISEGQRKQDQLYNFVQSVIVLDWFTKSPQNEIFLKGAVEAARKLRKTVSALWTDALAGSLGDSDKLSAAVIDSAEARRLEIDAAAFETILKYELSQLPAYLVERVGIYGTDDLINHGDVHLLEGTLKLVNQFVKDEMKRSGRSLAFDLFTACGFHAVRAVEQVARDYLKKLTGKDAQASEIPLGGVLRGFREYRDAKKMSDDSPLGLTISNLTRLNNIYRKPLTDPDMVLETRDAARQVFDLAALLISQMAENIAGIP